MVLIEAKRNEWSVDYWERRRPYWNYCELRKVRSDTIVMSSCYYQSVYMDIIKKYLIRKGESANDKDIASVAKTLSDESFDVSSSRLEVVLHEPLM